MQDGTPIIIKKVKKHGHGHDGGAWKVAYADFVTAMMAFFMVLWILGMNQEQKDEIAEYFKNPFPHPKGSIPLKPNVLPKGSTRPTSMGASAASTPTKSIGQEIDKAKMEKIKEQIQTKLAQDEGLKQLVTNGDIKMQMTPEGLKIELIENQADGEVFFVSGSAEIRPRAREVFAKIAPVLAESKRFLYVDGHTDSNPMSGAMDNYDLSTMRANAVRRVMEQSGLPESQVLEVRGKADKEPRLPEDPKHFSNRRVTVLLPYRYNRQPTMNLPASPQTEDDSALVRSGSVFGGVEKVRPAEKPTMTEPGIPDLRDKVTEH
ncbi:MAG: flagellar motor protein MotB [Armatimonadota bacterium]